MKYGVELQLGLVVVGQCLVVMSNTCTQSNSWKGIFRWDNYHPLPSPIYDPIPNSGTWTQSEINVKCEAHNIIIIHTCKCQGLFFLQSKLMKTIVLYHQNQTEEKNHAKNKTFIFQGTITGKGCGSLSIWQIFYIYCSFQQIQQKSSESTKWNINWML